MPDPQYPVVAPRLTAAEIAALGTPEDGWIVFNTDDDELQIANGGTFTAPGGGSGAPTTVDYLVGTTDAGLSNEIVVGTTPGGELGGTWASPSVDASHSGSTHAAVQAAAEATAASALAAHTGDTTDAHDASAISVDSTTLVGIATDVQGSLEELDNGIADHLADSSAAHAASAISADSTTLVGVGTDVQAVLEELDNSLATAVQNTRQVISGGGLTGGGDLSTDLTLVVGAGTGITVNADDVAVAYGTSSTTACVGNDSRLADSRAPSGSAGGVLDGTYPNPGLAAGVAGAGLAETSDVLSVNVDGSTLEISSDALRQKDAGTTNAKLADMAQSTIKGRAAAAGTGAPVDLTATQVRTILDSNTTPSTQAFSDAAAVGTADTFARGDHKHAMPALGTGATNACAGNDARLSDARTPTTHASTHKVLGSDALFIRKRAAGTSASGTPNTSVATLSADASSEFIFWHVVAAQTNAAGTQYTITITYSDATTTTLTSTAATVATTHGNAGGLEHTAAGGHVSNTACLAKAVTGIDVKTTGTGTGTRAAVIAAVQIPI